MTYGLQVLWSAVVTVLAYFGTITAVGWVTETTVAGWFAGARGTMGTGTPSGRAF